MNAPSGRVVSSGLLQTLNTIKPIYVASAISLALGLFFVFVWSPLPFGWLGIDHYDDRALTLAGGGSFDTTDVPWGYAYYLAFFYVIFGHYPWIPLVFQVLLNASVPVLLYHLVRPLADQRTAALSAALVGIVSFNTVYASTQSSDAVCTVLFLGSLLLFDRGRRFQRLSAFAASGLLAGLASQFRPNLILFPPLLAVVHLIGQRRTSRRVAEAGLYLTVAVTALVPWTVRNYRLTGDVLPTSTHGGYQLWLGTLEVGPYLERRPDNPRSLFAAPAFDYTSLDNVPLIVTAIADACDPSPTLVYWTDRDSTERRIEATAGEMRPVSFEVPAQPAPTTVYYYFETQTSSAANQIQRHTPVEGPGRPFVYFVATNHLGDLDRHHDLLDVFDLVRLLRWQAWHEPLPDGALWDLNTDGRVDEADTRAAVDRLSRNVDPALGDMVVKAIEAEPDGVLLRLVDGSTFRVPSGFTGVVTDLEARGGLAGKLLYSRLARRGSPGSASHAEDPCGNVDEVMVNEVFFRREPHWMRRYTALAMDNIRREPIAFLTASLYRIVRVFIIKGSDDRTTAQQFAASAMIYRLGFFASLTMFVTFAAGVSIAWRRHPQLGWLLLPIVYLPLTICFVLTNMRYSITVQPYVLTFVAVALLAGHARLFGKIGR